MPKQPLSVTLGAENLLWLRGRAASTKRKSLSEALDDLITAARTGKLAVGTPRSVVGTVDIADDDPNLEHADDYLRDLFSASLGRPMMVRDARATYGRARTRTTKTRRG